MNLRDRASYVRTFEMVETTPLRFRIEDAIEGPAGIPDTVRNMDARAGAMTEADDAGTPLDDRSGAVGHSQASSTSRYSRGARGKSDEIATRRAAHRQPKNVS